MLYNFKHLVKLTGQIIKKCEFLSSFQNEKLSVLRCDFCLKYQTQNYHTSTPRMRVNRELEYRRASKADAKAEYKVAETFKGDIAEKRSKGYFSSVDLPNTLFGGVPFKDLPIVYISATKNNTQMKLVDQNMVKVIRSAGMEGFKNARKGTNVAAQAVGTLFGHRAQRKGYKNVRVVIGGLGAGRQSSIKGLQLSGLNVVSITDNTIDSTSLRPRKQRRL